MPERRNVDRQSRDVLAEVLREYLEGDLSWSLVFDVVAEFDSSDDSVIELVCDSIFLSDLDEFNSAVKLSKPVWDELQRHILLLDSDRYIEFQNSTIWNQWQMLAFIGVIVFAVFGLAVGFWQALVWLSVPSGVLSWFIARKRSALNPPRPYQNVLYPFESFGSMKATLEEVRERCGFEKISYPNRTKTKSRRLGLSQKQSERLEFVIYLFVVPTIFLLPFQALPVFRRDYRVTASSGN